MIPTQPSVVRCPFLNTAHVPRLFEKYQLTTAGKLTEGYELGGGYDAMTEAALGIDRAAALKYFKDSDIPTYFDFVKWVRDNGSIDQAKIAEHNAAVDGYVHSDETAAEIRGTVCLSAERESELLGAEGAKLANNAVLLNLAQDLQTASLEFR